MARMSQKELLDEGIASMLGKAALGAGKGGLQAAGAAGNVLKYGSQAGVEGTLGGTFGAAKQGWQGTKEMLTGKAKKLDKFLDDQGLMVTPTKYPDPKNPKKDIKREGPGEKRIVGKIAIVDAIQYDFDNEGNKKPMAGASDEKRKFRYKDGRWEVLREKRRNSDIYGVKLDKEDIDEAKKDPDHPLTGKFIKHQTRKGNIAYGTLIGVVDEYGAIQPHSSSKAPGIYGVDVNALEESTEDEAAQSAPKTQQAEGTNQKDLLRQLHILRG